MPDVQSKAEIDPVFSGLVAALADSSKAIGDAATGAGPREWQSPPARGWSGDLTDPAGMVKPFDRDDLNDAYTKVVSDSQSPGTVGDVVALVTQIGYVGTMERSYRARHASPVRCLIVAAGRRRGHGHPAGVLKGAVLGHVTDTIAAGQAK